MKNKAKSMRNERGQALIIITFAIIGLIGITGLTVDGGMAYSDRRHAQNAADSAALAAGLAHARMDTDLFPTVADQDAALESAANVIAAVNGYNNNGESNTVEVTTTRNFTTGCPPYIAAEDNVDITVTIESHVGTTFGTIVGIQQLTNKVTATVRACGVYVGPLYKGQALQVWGDNAPGTECALQIAGSGDLYLTAAGMTVTGCAERTGSGDVVFNPTTGCVSAGAGATGFGAGQVCTTTPLALRYPDDVNMPLPELNCDGTEAGVTVLPDDPDDFPDGFTFENGIFCVIDSDTNTVGGDPDGPSDDPGFSVFTNKDIVLNNAVLYVKDTQFSVKQSGGGSLSGDGRTVNPYKGYIIIVEMEDLGNECPRYSGTGAAEAQQLELVGNAGSEFTGTIMAPSACVVWSGGSSGDMNAKIVSYRFRLTGSGDFTINYNEAPQPTDTIYPTVELLK